MFISMAYAQDAAAAAPSPVAQLVPFILVVVIFYFLMIRPQQKRYRDHKTMVEGVARGDEVVTGGGIIGKVTKVEDEVLQVEIADGVVVKTARATISNVMKKEAKKESKAKGQVTSKKKIANDN